MSYYLLPILRSARARARASVEIDRINQWRLDWAIGVAYAKGREHTLESDEIRRLLVAICRLTDDGGLTVIPSNYDHALLEEVARAAGAIRDEP